MYCGELLSWNNYYSPPRWPFKKLRLVKFHVRPLHYNLHYFQGIHCDARSCAKLINTHRWDNEKVVRCPSKCFRYLEIAVHFYYTLFNECDVSLNYVFISAWFVFSFSKKHGRRQDGFPGNLACVLHHSRKDSNFRFVAGVDTTLSPQPLCPAGLRATWVTLRGGRLISWPSRLKVP